MGTRADFYAGRGADAEWLGSIAWDGYPEGIASDVLSAPSESAFRARLAQFFAERDDVTPPEAGWPWPWETSHTTDYAYACDGDTVYASGFGGPWQVAADYDHDAEGDGRDAPVFPDMSERKNVQLGGSRSGLITVGAGPRAESAPAAVNAEPQPFDGAELELIAESLDAILGINQVAAESLGLRGIDDVGRGLLAELAQRARAAASAMFAAASAGPVSQDAQAALDDACTDLANRHGRCTVIELAPGAWVVVGLVDDIEMEFVTVRALGQLVQTQPSTRDEIRALREQSMIGVPEVLRRAVTPGADARAAR